MVTRPLALSALSLALAACTVGPDYVRPKSETPAHFIQQPTTPATARADADPAFWKSFQDPLLSQLVDYALAGNKDLAVALGRYHEAAALLRQARWNQTPNWQADADRQNRRSSAAEAPGENRHQRDQNIYQADVGFSWELDLFGRLRRATEAQRAEMQASAADLAALQVSIIGQLGQDYFLLRGLQEQLRIAQANAANQAHTAELLETRRREGYASAFDVDRSRAQLESTRSRIPALQAEVAQTAHAIAVLAGRRPDQLWTALTAEKPWPQLPQGVSIDSPENLLRRRPDVAAAERRLAAATARIGVATADLFPRISLSALLGTEALAAGDLFERDSQRRLLGLGLDGDFLNVGRVRAQIAASNAQAEQSLAAYDQSVLQALQDAEDALSQWQGSQGQLGHLQTAAEASQRAAEVARVRFRDGAIDTLDLLEAENTLLADQSALAQGRAGQGQALIGLYRALAGGWPERAPKQKLAEAETKNRL